MKQREGHKLRLTH